MAQDANPEAVDKLVSNGELIGVARQEIDDYYADDTNLLNEWFPFQAVDDTEFELNNTRITRRPAGVYRAWDAEAKLSKGGFSGRTEMIELPPISMKERLGEYMRLRARKISDDRIRNTILNPVIALTGQVYDRYLISAGQIIDASALAVDENGITEALVEWEREASMSSTVANNWGGAGEDPLNDLAAAVQASIDNGNPRPDYAVMTRARATALYQSDAMREYVLGSANSSRLAQVLPTQAAQVLEDLDLPAIRPFDGQVDVASADGTVTKTRLLNANKVYLTPAGALGSSIYGTTAEALELDLLPGAREGIVATTYTKDDPVTKMTKVTANGFPAFGNGMSQTIYALTVES